MKPSINIKFLDIHYLFYRSMIKTVFLYELLYIIGFVRPSICFFLLSNIYYDTYYLNMYLVPSYVFFIFIFKKILFPFFHFIFHLFLCFFICSLCCLWVKDCMIECMKCILCDTINSFIARYVHCSAVQSLHFFVIQIHGIKEGVQNIPKRRINIFNPPF